MSKIYANDGSLKDFDIDWPADQGEFDLRVRGYMKTEKAPVIVSNPNGKFELKMMCFSLCPAWSKEFPAKFSTYNARMDRPSTKSNAKIGEIERIYQVPTWREPFVNGQTCLIPMNSAIESSYFGKSAGKIIHFSTKDKSLYFVCGIWSTWLDKKSGEIHDTFALITDHPYKFFFEHGHDRSVLIINKSAQMDWLRNQKMKPEHRFDFLRQNRVTLDWDVQIDREMKSGWQKRAPDAEEIKNIQIWH